MNPVTATTEARTSYHHGNLRAALVETATELARQDGPDAVVMREVARRAGVSHNAAYRHFADRDALLAAVAAEGMTQLEETMRRRMAEVSETDPRRRASQRLRAAGRAYIEFASTEPGLFSVAFDSTKLAEGSPYEPSLEGPFVLLNALLDDGVAAGAISPDKRPMAEFGCWSAVHGFAILSGCEPVRELPEAARTAAMEVMLTVLEDGLA